MSVGSLVGYCITDRFPEEPSYQDLVSSVRSVTEAEVSQCHLPLNQNVTNKPLLLRQDLPTNV